MKPIKQNGSPKKGGQLQQPDPFKEIQEFMRCGCWELELNSYAVTWTDEMFTILKTTPQKTKPSYQSFLSFVHQDDIEYVDTLIQNSLRLKKSYSFFCRLVLKNETIIHIYTQAKFRYDSEGNIFSLFGIMHDITPIKLMQSKHCISEMMVQEKERERISKDLHDSVGQMLLGSYLHLNAIKVSIAKKNVTIAERISDVTSTIQNTIQEVRNISHNMAPFNMKKEGLLGSMQAICTTVKKNNGISIQFHPHIKQQLDTLTQTVIYRIFQELISNILKHSKCTNADISLFIKHKKIHLIVEDNGIGLKQGQKKSKSPGLGLVSIQNRVQLLNGDVKMNGKHGTRIEVMLPFKPVNAD